MRRPWKIALALLLFLLTIAGIGWVQLDAIAQNWLEQTASQALGVAVKIGRLDLRRFEGQLNIQNLTVDNPQGFTHPHLLEIERLNVTVVPSTLFSKTVQVPEFKSDGWVINVEQRMEKNNIQSILKPPDSNSSSPSPSDPSPGQQPGKTVHLAAIALSQIAVNFDLDLSPLGLPIPFLNQRKQWQYTVESFRVENLNLGIENSQEFMRSLFSSTVFGAIQKQNANPAQSLLEKIFKGQLPFDLPFPQSSPEADENPLPSSPEADETPLPFSPEADETPLPSSPEVDENAPLDQT
jgi:AsmA family